MAKKPETKADPTHERRRLNLRLLTAQWGNATTLAGKLGHSGPSYISQMLSGLRPITEKTARGIEEKLELPLGWMDSDHGAARPAQVDDGLLTECLLLAGVLLDERGVTIPAGKLTALVALIYEDARRHGTVSEAYAKRLIELTR